MYVDLSLTLDGFSRFLRYRVCDLYRPLSTPFPYSVDGAPPRLHYVDGIKLRNAFVSTSARIDPFFLNERDPVTTVHAIQGINHLDAPRLSVGLQGNLLLVAEADVVRFGYADPPQVSVMIPPNIAMLVRLTVDQQGVLRLMGEPDIPADVAARVGPQLLAFIRRVFTIDQPLPLTSVLSQALPPDQGVVVNSGLCVIPGERVTARFETQPIVGPSTNSTPTAVRVGRLLERPGPEPARTAGLGDRRADRAIRGDGWAGRAGGALEADTVLV